MDVKKSLNKYSSNTNIKKEFLDVHKFHPYPAKFHPKLPREAIKKYTNPGDYILDPFCGCGTTLVESKIASRNSIGVDTNPLAVFISNTKTTSIEEERLKTIHNHLKRIHKKIDMLYDENASKSICYEIPNFYNRDHWFQKNVQKELSVIKCYLGTIEDKKIKKFLKLAMSSIIVKVSNQESDKRYAAIDKGIQNKQTFEEFQKKTLEMIEGIKEFNKHTKDVKAIAYNLDARDIRVLANNSIDLIVTSPPYANTYDYYLYHKMRMFWLDMDYKKAQKEEIGSRHKYSSQKKDVKIFLKNLKKCLEEMQRVLKPSKTAIFVIGDSVIRGKFIKMDKKIEELCYDLELRINNKRIQDLGEYTSFNKSFRKNNKSEYVLQLKKEG